MISRHFGTPDTISPLRGINFSSCRTIKISTPVGVDIFMVRPTRFAPPGHKLRTVSGNKNTHPGGVGIFMVRPTRFERATYRVGVCHSIQLSYGRVLVSKRLYYSKLCPESKVKKENFSAKLRRPPDSRLFSVAFCGTIQKNVPAGGLPCLTFPDSVPRSTASTGPMWSTM